MIFSNFKKHLNKDFCKKRIANNEIKYMRILSENKVILSIFFWSLLVVTLIINLILSSLSSLNNTFLHKPNPGFFKSLFNFIYVFKYPVVYFIVYLFVFIVIFKITVNLKASFASIEGGEKGTSRFTTSEEIEQQYKSIPELETDEERENNGYEGKGGIVISRDANKIFIDDGPSNNLIIGTTRSGKGELFIFPTLDAYSRAKEKASLIINDPKGELIASSKETLEQRGYKVELLNLVQPMNSLSYNPLQLIIDACERKNYGEAQGLCKTLTYTLYYKPDVKDPFFNTSAMSLVNALILALIEKVFEDVEKIKFKIKETNEILKDIADKKHKEQLETKILDYYKQIEETKAKVTLYSVANMLSELGAKEDSFGNNELDKYFNNLSQESVAKMQYATSNFAKGQTRGAIFATAMSELQIFTLDEMAKMTSKNSVNLRDIGFKNNVTDKPIALFMTTPDYDCSNHVIASIFVRQLYYVLAKEAFLSITGKCEREVVFILDEFGNMPAIEGMSSIITVCLGRNIKFNLVIQAYSQLEEKYGKSYKTIVGNCGNQIYILTTEEETAEKVSKLVGEHTIITYSRSGELFDITKHQTESVDSRRLLNSNELMSLREGEMVVVRVIKRTDLKGNSITPRPIFNTGKNKMKYRYEYLSNFFDTSKTLHSVKIENVLHRDLVLRDLLMFGVSSEESNEIEPKEIIPEPNDKIDYEMCEIFENEEIDEINYILQEYGDKSLFSFNSYVSEFNNLYNRSNYKKLSKFYDYAIKQLSIRGGNDGDIN